MTPEELLAQANRLLATPVPGTRGRWPRACAWLIRLALERSLDEYWASSLPGAEDCSMRAQLLILPQYAGESVAAAARDAWFGLAGAAHHHAYDLAPTSVELRRWHELVLSICTNLAVAPRAATNG
jgi:hypothetical protein